MLAAYAGHAELTKGLLQRKADPNRLNDLGQSMIAGAVFKAHDEVVRILVEAGADPRIGKPTAIEAAHMFGRKEFMGLLGAKEGDIGADVPTPPSACPAKNSSLKEYDHSLLHCSHLLPKDLQRLPRKCSCIHLHRITLLDRTNSMGLLI